MKKTKRSLRASLETGASVGEQEGTPSWGSPDQTYRISGDLSRYEGAHRLLPQGGNGRHAPISSSSTVERLGHSHGARVNGGMIEHPTRFETQGLVLERMVQNLSVPQYSHSLIWRQRGMPGKVDAPDGTPRATGRIKAVITHENGLGPAYARSGPSGHDPAATPVSTNYLRQVSGPASGDLSRYVGAAELLAQPVGNASGFPREHTASQFPTMGEEILDGFMARTEREAASYVPPYKPVRPRNNRMVGQSQQGA